MGKSVVEAGPEGRSAGGERAPSRDELRVMQFLADGYSDPQIARILGISLVTVRRRAQRFCRFLGAKSRLQAMAEAVARGWVTTATAATPVGGAADTDDPEPRGPK